MAQRQSSHSFSLSFVSVSLLSAVAFLSSEVAAKAISTSVFPNSACAGSSSGNGLVGIGRVTLSSGEVETHCGCPSDNLPSFEACATSSVGESVCNSVLDLESGEFTASCSILACQGSSCPTTVVNTVVVDDDDCFASGKGTLGFSTTDGQSRCACISDEEEGFTICPTVENGRASCVSVDNDFLGMAYSTKETVECGITCLDGYILSAAGTCTKLAKRGATYSSSHSAVPHHSTSSHHHHHKSTTTPSVPTGSSTTKKHHHSKSYTTSPGTHHSKSSTTSPATATSTTKKYHHHHHKSSTTPSIPESSSSSHHSKKHHHKTSSTSSTASTTVYSSSHSASSTPKMRARAADEFVFTLDVCAADERTCSSGTYDDFTCVRLDDVTECGGCHSTGDAVDCMDIPGIASAVCLRGGCVVRSCHPGYEQTSEGTCSLRE